MALSSGDAGLMSGRFTPALFRRVPGLATLRGVRSAGAGSRAIKEAASGWEKAGHLGRLWAVETNLGDGATRKACRQTIGTRPAYEL